MSKSLTFLQLSPEFGGTKFGPFEGVEIRLGSDPQRNDITLPEALGVSPEHLKILRQQDDSYIIAPIDRTATVYIFRATGGKPKQITTPVAVISGDAFALVTEEGPRFFLLTEMAKKANLEDENLQGPGLKMPQGPRAQGIFKEIKRRGLAKALTSGVGNQAMRTWTFVKTGQLFSPMYIVAGMTMLSGYLFAGGTTCAVFSLSSGKQQAKTQLSECRDQLGVGGDVEDPNAEPTVPILTQRLLDDKSWKITLNEDTQFRQAYGQKMKLVFSQAAFYEWVYTNPESQNRYAEYKKALEAKGLEDPLVRILSYSAALPALGGASVEWGISTDSEDNEVCTRGPLQLTYRQAKNIGLFDIYLDAQVPRNVAISNDVDEQVRALRKTANMADVNPKFQNDHIEMAGLGQAVDCIYLKGEDERSDMDAIADGISRLYAGRSRTMPQIDEMNGLLARIMMYYGTDFMRGFDELKFRPVPPLTVQLDLNESGAIIEKRKKYLVEQSANLLARAAAIPCMATLDKEVQTQPPSFMGKLPGLGSCAIVKIFVDFDRL
ncbi:MAG: FHA domain-containing protein [Proteobacteria bacterium]|nr:FHA domain-containing protein [Pseudomonadota bacterium]